MESEFEERLLTFTQQNATKMIRCMTPPRLQIHCDEARSIRSTTLRAMVYPLPPPPPPTEHRKPPRRVKPTTERYHTLTTLTSGGGTSSPSLLSFSFNASSDHWPQQRSVRVRQSVLAPQFQAAGPGDHDSVVYEARVNVASVQA